MMRNFSESIFGKAVLAMAVLFMFASLEALAQSTTDKNDIGFLYAFGAYVGPQGKGNVISVQNETSLRSGDRLKLLFEPKNDQYFYLLHVSSQGNLTSLYPAQGQLAGVAEGTQVFVPPGVKWFELDDHPGQEKFFFIATAERLERLEELCARHASLNQKLELQASTEAILDEIKRLRQKHKQLSAPAEKPVRIGGSVRGEQPSDVPAVADITPLAAEVKAPGFYSRTFTIDHR
jgi:hypothetical protein